LEEKATRNKDMVFAKKLLLEILVITAFTKDFGSCTASKDEIISPMVDSEFDQLLKTLF
jgi:hypothetical protein